MNILVTGATGFIGEVLCRKLAESGSTVMALYRSSEKVPEKSHRNIRYVKGDITSVDTLEAVIRQCDRIYHLAAYARVYARDPSTYRRANYDATISILNLACKHQVSKVVVCSTAGVFGPADSSVPIDETAKRSVDFFSDYERYKDQADKEIVKRFASRINVVIVCPSRVFGPGPLHESNSVTRLMRSYCQGKFRFLPGNGHALGNYIYVEDVAEGMILAMARGKSGERYLLGGENLSYREFFRKVGNISGKNYTMIPVPTPIVIFFARCMTLFARITGTTPALTSGWARKYLYNWPCTSAKAQDHLGYAPLPVDVGIRKTLDWLNDKC